MIKVLGKNVLLYVYRSGSPVLSVCATNVSRRESSGSVSLLTKGSGKTRIYKGTVQDSTVTLDGVRTLNDSSVWQIDDFIIGNTERIIIIYEDSIGNQVSYDGNVLITGIDDSNEAAGFSTYSVTMLRSGPWSGLITAPTGGLLDSDGNPILDSDGNPIITG